MLSKLFLLFGCFMIWRMLRSVFGRALRGQRPASDIGGTDEAPPYDNLSRQDISDADFEEIEDERP